MERIAQGVEAAITKANIQQLSGIANRTGRFVIMLLMSAVGYDLKSIHTHTNTSRIGTPST